MKNPFLLLFLLGGLLLTAACNDDDPEVDNNVRFRMAAKANNTDFALGSLYTNGAGQEYRLETLTFFASPIVLVKENGEEVVVSDVEFYHWDNELPVVEVNVPAGHYSAIRFGLGLTPALNATDPGHGS